MTEADFQRTVIDAAQALGWMCAHFRPAQTAQGWRTAVSADGKGFPDLVLVRDRVLFIELKADRGKQTADQRAWQHQIHRALNRWHDGVTLEIPAAAAMPFSMRVAAPFTYHVWRPRDWSWIESTLRGEELKIDD